MPVQAKLTNYSDNNKLKFVCLHYMAICKRILLWLFAGLLHSIVFAQPVSFEYITTNNGLPQSTIRGILKDKFGFMWFGTWNGLCRYDGYSFKVYYNRPGDTTSITSNRIHHLFKDSGGNIWATVFGQRVCRYNYETDDFTRFNLADLTPILRDSTNRRLDLEVLQHARELLNKTIGPFHLSETKESIVFETPLGVRGHLNDSRVNCMYLDDAGILWIGTGSGGVNKADLSANKFQNQPIYLSRQNNERIGVRTIMVEKESLWLGTEDNGVVVLDRLTGQQKFLTPQLSGQNIKVLFKDSRGNIWIGKRPGLDRYNPRTKQIVNCFNTASQSSYSRFYAVAEDPVTRELWFLYYNGILKYNPQTNSFQKQQIEAYSRSGAGCLFFDSKNNLWIGTEYDGVIQIKRDPRTNAWVDTVQYTSLASNERSPDERVYAVVEDASGAVWVGAANGLSKIDPLRKTLKAFTVNDGLADHYITQIIAETKDYIWFAYQNGLGKLNIKTNQIQNYAVKGPGQEYEFVDGAGSFDRASGQMFFGTNEGIVYFNPREIVDNPFLPRTVFTSLQVLNRTINVGDSINGRVMLTTPLHMASSITLSHEEKSFSVAFSALHFSSPSKNQYAYMLEGQDKDWIYTDASRRFASYSNLAPGKYVLKVKASNSDGVWNTTPAVLRIVVLPPWWRTWWACSIYAALILLVIFGIYRIVQVRQQYHRQILTERLRAEKAQELDQVKSSFFTNVSHEFRTPLTLIVDPLRSLLTKKDASPGEMAHYNVMYRNAQRLLALINQFLDFRKIESGKMQLQPRLQDLVPFVRNTAAAFDFKASEQNIDFSVSASPEKIILGFDADIAGKILYNLVSNAFKFTPRSGRISVAITADSERPPQVTIVVADTGMGIPSDKLDKIFDPFFQVEGQVQHVGTGVGLSLTRELVGLHNGTISVSSQLHKGTVFTVTLDDLPTDGLAQPQSTNLPEEVVSTAMVTSTDAELPEGEQPILLLVEDNDDIRNYIKQNFTDNFRVIEAANGIEGFEKAIAQIPDLVISDVMMPGMNGLELCAKLKTDEKTSHIPVVLLTARQSDQYEAEGYETGADAYIVKPFSMPLLQVRVRNLIEIRVKLRTLFGQSPESFTNPVGLNAADKAFLAKATDLVATNMADAEVNVEWLAAQLFMSRTQLYRKVKAITNQSVHEFVTGIRLSKAAELLLQGENSVTEIAFLVGYADATSFSRMFQKQYGTTPKKYSLQQKS